MATAKAPIAKKAHVPVRPTAAKNRPAIRSPRSVIESEDIHLPQDETVADLHGVIEGDMQSIRRTARGGEVNHAEALQRLFASEAFMQDLLLIQIAPAGVNENPIAQVIVNNRQFDIPRGRQVRVRRYVVEALAHAKQANFSTRRAQLGDPNHMTTREQNVWSFPFSVMLDPRGVDGFKWVEKVMSDPN